MFKIIPEPHFTVPVKLTVPGQELPAEIALKFKHKCKEALLAFIDSLPGRDDVSLIGEIVADWEGVDLHYDEDHLRVMLGNYPAAAEEIYQQYLRALTESRLKN